VYRAPDARQLYVRDLGSGETARLPGSELVERAPFFSPDGVWVGFVAAGKLKKLRLDGMGAVDIGDVPPNRGWSWGRDGMIVFGGQATGLMRVSADGGTPQVLSTLDPTNGENSHRWPDILPNGKGVIFAAVVSGNHDDSRIEVLSFDTGERRFLVNASFARYAPTGHLIYAREDTLFAVPFDIDRMEVNGSGIPVQPGVVVSSAGPGSANFTFANDGTLVYLARPSDQRRLVLVDLQGNVEPLAAPPMRYSAARFSPNGERLALVVGGDTGAYWAIHSYELAQERLSLLTSRIEESSGTDFQLMDGVAIHPDGKTLAVNGTAPGMGQILFSIALDGSSQPIRLTNPPGFQYPGVWSADGQHLLYLDQAEERGNRGIHEVSVETRSTRVVVDVLGVQREPALSRDDLWLAYSSTESGRREVYVTRYRTTRGRQQVSREGGCCPVWAPDGRTLYYFMNGSGMMAAAIRTSPELSVGRPRLIFEGDYHSEGGGFARGFDIAPDGSKFVMIESLGAPGLTEFQIVLNWFDEVNRLAPTTQ